MAVSKATAKIIADVRKQFGKESARFLSDGSAGNVTDVLPTGIGVLDNYVLGIGGLPAGRLVEVSGDEAAGKTSFVIHLMARAQADGWPVVLAEPEAALQDERAAMFGVDLDNVVLLGAGCVEDVFGEIAEAIRAVPKGTPSLHVWDSIAATPTRREIDEGIMGKDKIADLAFVLSKKTKQICKLAAEHNALLVFVNQIREKVGVMFGDNRTTPGGHAVKFHSSMRLMLSSGKATKAGVEHTGKAVKFMGRKNKLSVPWRKAAVRLNYDTGWEDQWSTLNHAKERKLIGSLAKGAAAHQEAVEALGWSKSDG